MVFLCVAYGAGLFAEILGMPALVGNIITGMILGPPLLDFCPFPEAMVLVGEIGLVMLLLEAGVEVDVNQLKQTGVRALSMAMTGTVLPLCTAMGLAIAYGLPVKSALSVGMAFSPTSLGVASSALTAGKMADSPMGQLVCAACVFDDIMALILLAMLEVLVKPDPAIIEYFYPIFSAVGFLLLLGGLAVTVAPKIIEHKFLRLFPENYRIKAMFCLMAVLTMAYMPLLYYTKASYLSGAFLAGFNFAQIPHAHHDFMDNVHQTMMWLMRVFFAASIGFQIPVKYFNDASVIGWGFIFYIAVLMKLPLALYVPAFQDKSAASKWFDPHTRDRVLTALAMSCRGEFSFIIAGFALGQGLFEPEAYASIVWAVLFSSITSPFLLLQGISYYNKKKAKHLEETNPLAGAGRSKDGTMPAYIHIQAKTRVIVGLNETFIAIARELDLDVADFRTSHKRGVDAIMTSDLYVVDKKLRVQIPTISKLRKIKHAYHASCHNLRELVDKSENASAAQTPSLRSSFRLSSQDLGKLDDSFKDNTEDYDILKENAKENDSINARCKAIQKEFLEKLDMDDAKVLVDQWEPFDWMAALDSLADLHDDDGSKPDIDYFMDLFAKMDDDKSGNIDQGELFQALKKVGVKVTKQQVEAMMTVIDEDGNGEIDTKEWREVCSYYLDGRGHGDHADILRKNRVSKINQKRTQILEEKAAEVPVPKADLPRVTSRVSFAGSEGEAEVQVRGGFPMEVVGEDRMQARQRQGSGLSAGGEEDGDGIVF